MVRTSQKILNISPMLLAVLLFAFSASPVKAEVYKCENAKGKIVYSDTPCHINSTQTITDIQANLDMDQDDLQPSEKKKSSVMLQLDDAIESAIAREDFAHAQALAITSEQQQWIAAAKKDAARNAPVGRTDADLIAEKSNSDECAQAKLSLEKEAGSTFRKPDVLAAKTSLMRASCGVGEEAQPGYSSPIYVNRHSPFFFDPYRYYSYKNLGHFPHRPRPMQPAVSITITK